MTGSRSRRPNESGGDQELRGGVFPRAGEISGDPAASALRWIAGHCRFVATSLPRGELGVQFAGQLLAAIPDACRRRVPDLTGTAPELLAACVDYGLLTEMPSPRVIRAVPRLIAGHSPMLESRGKRCWTLWIVHLLDPGMLAKIQRRTPASQLEVCGPVVPSRARSRGHLAAEARALTAELAAERAACTEFRERCEALTRERDAKVAALDQMLLEAARLAERGAEVTADLEVARGKIADDAGLRAQLEEALAELAVLRDLVGPIREENARLRAELDQAKELSRALAERLGRHEQVEELGAVAVNMLRSLLRGKKSGDGPAKG